MVKLVKATVLGGLVVILPVVVAGFISLKLILAAEALIEPLARMLAFPPVMARGVALVLVLGGCFVAGLLVQTPLGKRGNRWFELTVLEKLPAYDVLRSIGRQFAGQNDERRFAPALAEIEDALVPAFIVERHDDGRLTVFVPAVPTPTIGAIYILAPERVHRVPLPIAKTLQCVSHWGIGSRELVAAAQLPAAGIKSSS